jgi:hypothetical protein
VGELVSGRADRRGSGSAGCGGNSFVAGTLVATAIGMVAIEAIRVGDKVFAEDPETGEQGYFEVVALTNHPTSEILEITIESSDDEDTGGDETDEAGSGETSRDVMRTTADHPVYVEGKGWIWAENLAIGDRLRRADGGTATVLAIERIELDELQPVYNFTVKGPHTYFVMDSEILVHNTACSFDDNVGRWRDSKGRFTKQPSTEGYDHRLPRELVDISQRVKAMTPAQKPRQGSADLDFLYRQAATADAELRQITRKIAELTGGEPGYRPDGLKLRERALEKIGSDYRDASELLDIAGSKIVYDSVTDVYKALETIGRLYANEGGTGQLVRVKDRFIEPRPSGYRDILLNLEMSNGHVVELRLHLKHIDIVSGVEHDLYKMKRSIEAGANTEGRTYTAQERLLITEIERTTRHIYEDAWQLALRELSGTYPLRSR